MNNTEEFGNKERDFEKSVEIIGSHGKRSTCILRTKKFFRLVPDFIRK